MKPLRSILTASIALALFSTIALAETFPIFEDAAGSATANTIAKATGAAKTLAVSSRSNAFINFSVGSSGIDPATVTAARLVIFVPKSSVAGTLSIKNLTSGFTETIATKTITAPTIGATLDTIDLATIPLKGDYFISDITTQVKAWLTTPAGEFGIAITSDGTATATLASKEGAGSGHPAFIEVDVTPSSGGAISGTTGTFNGTVTVAGTAAGSESLRLSGQEFNTAGNSSTDGISLLLGINRNNNHQLWIGNSDQLAVNASNPVIRISPQTSTATASFIDCVATDGSTPLALSLGANNALTLAADGKVGVGVTTPLAIFNVHTGVDQNLLVRPGAEIGTTDGIGIQSVNDTNTLNAPLTLTASEFTILGGNVGIGAFHPSFKLDVNGSLRCVGAVNTSSDARYKSDIRPVTGALETIGALRGVSYEWNRAAFPEKNFPERRSLGFIAQEVEKVLPNVVTKDTEGYYSVSYSEVIPVLVEATKELRAENAALKAANLALAEKMAAFDRQLAALQADRNDRPARTVRASLDLK